MYHLYKPVQLGSAALDVRERMLDFSSTQTRREFVGKVLDYRVVLTAVLMIIDIRCVGGAIAVALRPQSAFIH